MSWEAIRGLLARSPETAGEVVIGNPNEIWSELQRLMAERDRAVELLMRAAIVVLAVESQKQQHSPFSTALRNIPTLASEIMDFLRELEGE